LRALQQFVATQGDAGLHELATARAMIGDVLAAQDKLEAAIAAWRDYLKQCPSHGQWERVQRAIVEAEYQIAWNSYAAGKEKFAAARAQFAEFARSYPLDARNPQILFLLGDMLRQEQQHEAARDAFARCVGKYPGKDASSQAQYGIGELYEKELFDFDKALQAYKAVTWGAWAGPAQQRIALLTQKSLQLQTERIFRTDEKPCFVLTSRNIEKVRVRVFRLDLLDYFRATHSAGDVQQLDIEVIEADRTFDSPVPDYARHRETRREVPLPFATPGAYVVKVDEAELEATTMVLVSDLAMTVKSNRHELFVFTQNTRDDRVQGGVRVLVSDGQKVIAEGSTGTDGSYRYRGKELQNLDGLRVFAVDGSGSGAGTVDLSGLGFAQGLQPKGYLFTDRPLYQPGQRVNLKGVVREVENGLYKLPAADGYRLQVHSAEGRLMLQRELRFTAFGTFAAEVDLPADADLGTWRAGVTRAGHDDLVFHGSFDVARYERPRLQLRAECEQSVVFRGDRIQGRFVASYFFGEPAFGKEIRYQLRLPDGAVVQRQGTTNAAGEVAFAFETTEFGEEALALLSAQIVAENAAVQTVVPVVTTEFEPRVSTARPVYLAGEVIDAAVEIRDRSGKPLAREATAVLLRLEQRAANKNPAVQQSLTTVEVEVARKPLRTGADGKAVVQLRADQGGGHRVRVEAKDRFGNVTSGDAELLVSGDDDKIKLRLLGDRDSYKVGDKAVVRVVNRAGARLALVAVQGDSVLAHEAKVIPAGESELAIELQPLHAPNFALGVSMVDGNKLHLAERGFVVLRDLQIGVEAPVTAAPGAEVELAVTARDPQGRPVAAEVALAMVDEALLAVRPDGTPAIGGFFYGDRRETTFRTVSSCTWSYQGRSQRISEALLAEERRAEHAAGATEPRGGGAGGRGPITGGPGGPAASEPASDARMDPRRSGLPGVQQAGNVRRTRAGQQVEAQQEAQVGQQLAVQTVTGSDNFFLGQTRNGTQVRLPFDLGTGGWETNVGSVQLFGIYVWRGLGQPPAGAIVPPDQPRTNFSETGAWLSAVLTDANGRGIAKVTLPHK
ncbi:MAG: tetratricopeptide repeat protein, partial [Planctomycetes bacterium]|nr:tetratricopeptide repeat protein [Planctomycetota bacterium]